ncbi:MAG: hypothetical protein JKY15_06390 [Deltaproteobacteria bacterium]|nr:hypothetical protein [Deltaproteobacteria bacterium]
MSAQVLAAVIPLRCKTSGDSLDAQQAVRRRAWASRCFPHHRGAINFHSQMLDEATNKLSEGYPTFAHIEDNGVISNPENWFAPTDEQADCTLPNNYFLITYCAAGCYMPKERVWFQNSDVEIGIAHEQQLSQVMTLDSNFDYPNLKFSSSDVESYITDLVPGWQDILEITALSGGSIRVTTNHPLVDGEGRMRSAHSLTTQDSLMRSDGKLDPIISVDSKKYFGKVYNLEVTNQNLSEKIIVAEGYLNGTLYYQNEGLKDLNRIILRTNVIPNSLVN